ncbi:MAG: ATP-dependent DNA helicase RecG [Patescibacteria group bacterium]|jgi:ATP-dependent DNA helicase RecG
MDIPFKQPITSLNRVGQTLSRRLKKINLETTLDLIYYFPFRYEDFSKITKIADLQPDQQTTVKGKIELLNSRRSFRRRMMITEAVIADESESVKIVWFNQPYIAKILQSGDEIFVSGKVSSDTLGVCFKNPVYEKVKTETAHTARIVPIYPLTEGITQKQIRFLISQIAHQTSKLHDWLPEEIIKKYKLLPLNISLKQIHFPDNFIKLNEARRRLSFDEIFTLQLFNLKNKKDAEQNKAFPVPFFQDPIKNLVANLPFSLTSGQKKCAWRIIRDIEKQKPMNRLLEGDVGSGKTVIAAMAMYNAALSGYQSALMAPTEILAKQHYDTLEKILGKDTVSLITRTTKKTSKDQKIFVGTHALIQKKIKFKKLALVVIDEQHRFGVAQRQALQEKSEDERIPHLLSLTATPIPRTLALTIYGDLDLSILSELPKGRKKIITKIVSEEKRQKAYEFIKNKIKNGDQAFVVCPLILESDKLGVKSVEQEYKKLKEEVFPDLRIAMLHGKSKDKEKENIMRDFKNKKYDLLVATAVVEVGVDVPNATIMIIEGADRFGLSQLHQFRGRVGRSSKQSYCLLFTESKSEKTLQRLEALTKSQDGFKLAEYDLKMRGPGAIFSAQQSGFISAFKIADLTDHILIAEAKEAAENMIDQMEKYPLVVLKMQKFKNIIHLE